jgi:hypothetical protein
MRDFNPTKPYFALTEFAESLGWRGLRMWQHVDKGQIITWYATTDQKFFLQINEHPVGSTTRHAAAVFARRYNLCTPWNTFGISDKSAAQRLSGWLRRSNFRDRTWRRAFRRDHPECFQLSPPWKSLEFREA